MRLQLSAKAQELTLESDHYQITYNRFGVNIRESSVVTLEHYFALRSLQTTIRGNVNERYRQLSSQKYVVEIKEQLIKQIVLVVLQNNSSITKIYKRRYHTIDI